MLDPLPADQAFADLDGLESITAAAFGQRRKMLRAALKTLPGAVEALDAAGIDPTRRAETLTQSEFRALAAAARWPLSHTRSSDDTLRREPPPPSPPSRPLRVRSTSPCQKQVEATHRPLCLPQSAGLGEVRSRAKHARRRGGARSGSGQLVVRVPEPGSVVFKEPPQSAPLDPRLRGGCGDEGMLTNARYTHSVIPRA